jgi:hypothetical protein
MMELMESETQWNQAEWNRVVTTPGPTYFRYILKGVYIHCITAAKVSTYDHTSLKINATDEMNIFLVSFPGEVIGATYGAGAIRQEVLDNWCVGHEVGHQFGLAHSFEGIPPDSQCPDMWTQAWAWDDDCNNTTNSINGFRCWSSDTYYERNVPPNTTKENIDVNSDGILTVPPDFIERPCEPEWTPQGVHPCYRHPCCEWRRQDNNIMGYSSWSRNQEYCALTPCQLGIMLHRASTSMCSYIEKVGGIPPPSAFISILPSDDFRENYCSYCLRLEASMNDAEYKLDIYDNTTSNLLTTTDWLEGPAELYCIKTIKEKTSHSTWFGGFLPNHGYTAVLTVRNEEDEEDSFTLEFTTPETNCNLLTPQDFTVSPSPIIQPLIIFHYDLPFTADVNIFAAHSYHGMYGLLSTVDNQIEGGHDLSINTSTWYSGINYIIIQIRDEVYSTAVVKP